VLPLEHPTLAAFSALLVLTGVGTVAHRGVIILLLLDGIDREEVHLGPVWG